MNISLPTDVEYILNSLINHNFKAYIIGGCVRDFLMGKQPHDYDITTNATPSEIKEVFANEKTIDTGIKHGTVSVLINNVTYEITTFRSDNDYKDHRHPSSITFSNNLYDDSCRRDFTMNSIAYNHIDGLIDYHHGIEDIEAKIIRCIGNPDERFNEDALRILRALRFSATLDFSIEANTSLSITQNRHLLKYISAERIYNELARLLVQPSAGNILYLYKKVFVQLFDSLLDLSNYDYQQITVSINQLPKDFTTRMACFIHKLTDYETVLQSLKLSNQQYKDIDILVRHYYDFIEYGKPAIKRKMLEIGDDSLLKLLDLQYNEKFITYQQYEYFLKTIIEIQDNNECYRIRQLDIKGNELLQIGFSGEEISKVLNSLLFAVIDEQLPNEKEVLINACKILFQKHQRVSSR